MSLISGQDNKPAELMFNQNPEKAQIVTSEIALFWRACDLGYYVGYKITESYYNRAKDKKQAINDILDIKDFNGFLKASGYDEKFSVE